MKFMAVILLFSGCASRINAPESAVYREARARWTMKQVHELKQWGYPK